MKSTKSLPFLALAVALVAPAGAERLAIPLSHPGEPVRLEASLLYGGIMVEVHEDSDQVIVETIAEETEIEPDERGGLRRIANRSVGLTLEEKGNEIQLSADARNAVDFKIWVPVNTSLRLHTVNDGNLLVRGVRGEVELNNTNGDVEAHEVAGSVVAHSVNGEVKVVLTEVDPGKALSFTTLNGDVDVTFPPNIAAAFEMRSDHGDIYTDFDLEVEQTPTRVNEERRGEAYVVSVEREMRGTINGGGQTITFRTFNGDIYIRKGSD